VNQGLILGEDMQKMSKSRGNVVNPDHVVEEYGADSLRLFEMFMGPLEQMKPWSTKGVEGVYRFLGRVWRLMMDAADEDGTTWRLSDKVKEAEGSPALLKVVHETIRKVGADIDSMSFNTAISQMMICVNELTSAEVRPVSALASLLQVLNPFAPHISEELYERLAQQFPSLPKGPLSELPWPKYEERYLVEDSIEIVLQVNGKVRDKVRVAVASSQDELKAAAMASEKIQEAMAGKQIKNVIVVPKRLVNVVVI